MTAPTTIEPPSLVTRGACLADRIHLPLAGLLTAFLAFRAGGFFADTTAVAALVLAGALLLRITLSADPFAGWSRAAAAAVLAAAGFASWTLISARWSGAAGRGVVEFDRALLCVLALAFYASVPRDRDSLTVLLRWVLAAFTAVAIAGLASRLAPDVFPISGSHLAERLSFPLTYWNAEGIAAALGVVLALHHSSGSQEPRWIRVAATAALPALVTTVYFTFSRGAIAAGALGVLAYVVLARPRRLVFTVAAAAPAGGVALIAAYGADALATEAYFAPPGPAQGHGVAVVLAACCVAAGLVRTLLLRPESRLDRVVLPRPRALLAGLAIAAVLAGTAAAVVFDVPGRVDRELTAFQRGDFVPQTGDARDRLTERGNNGRVALWRVAGDSWAGDRWRGTGAGTFRLEWERGRPVRMTVTDGHSLYLEVLTELGIAGLALLVVVLAVPLGVAAHRLRGRERHTHAALLAAGLALLVHAGADWDWEMPAVFLWLLAASGVVIAAPRGRGRVIAPGRVGRVVAGLACLALAATPWLVMRSQSSLEAAASAFARGDCRAAIDHALASRDALAMRAEPFELLGYCDLRVGEPSLAVRAMRAAHERDPGNWQYAYGLALAQARAGQDPRPAAALAVRLDPREPVARAFARDLRGASKREWPRAAARASLPPGLAGG
jgi:O-antigen ligase